MGNLRFLFLPSFFTVLITSTLAEPPPPQFRKIKTNMDFYITPDIPPPPSTPTPSSPSSSHETAPLASWEIILLNDILFEIAVVGCPSLQTEDVIDIKSYISEQLYSAPEKAQLASNFTSVYDELSNCLEHHSENSDFKQPSDVPTQEIQIEPFSTSVLDSSEENIYETSSPASTESDGTTSAPTGTEGTTQSSSAIAEEYLLFLESSKGKPKVQVGDTTTPPQVEVIDSTPMPMKPEEMPTDQPQATTEEMQTSTEVPAPEAPGFFGKVQNFFSQAFEKTKSFFRWVFGFGPSSSKRSKREVHANKKLLHKGRQHFRGVFKAVARITSKSCPDLVNSHWQFLDNALTEIYTYVDDHLQVQMNKTSPHDFSLDRHLGKKLKNCSKKAFTFFNL